MTKRIAPSVEASAEEWANFVVDVATNPAGGVVVGTPDEYKILAAGLVAWAETRGGEGVIGDIFALTENNEVFSRGEDMGMALFAVSFNAMESTNFDTILYALTYMMGAYPDLYQKWIATAGTNSTNGREEISRENNIARGVRNAVYKKFPDTTQGVWAETDGGTVPLPQDPAERRRQLLLGRAVELLDREVLWSDRELLDLLFSNSFKKAARFFAKDPENEIAVVMAEAVEQNTWRGQAVAATRPVTSSEVEAYLTAPSGVSWNAVAELAENGWSDEKINQFASLALRNAKIAFDMKAGGRVEKKVLETIGDKDWASGASTQSLAIAYCMEPSDERLQALEKMNTARDRMQFQHVLQKTLIQAGVRRRAVAMDKHRDAITKMLSGSWSTALAELGLPSRS